MKKIIIGFVLVLLLLCGSALSNQEAVFVVSADGSHKTSIPSGWNNINVVNNLNWVHQDTMNGWDNINKRYVVPVTGKYMIIGNVQFENWWAGGNSYASILKNGVVVLSGMNVQNPYSFGPSIIGIVDANAGDYLQLSVCQDSGTTMQIVQWSQTSFQGFWLGL
jgi:hypothetical protein